MTLRTLVAEMIGCKKIAVASESYGKIMRLMRRGVAKLGAGLAGFAFFELS